MRAEAACTISAVRKRRFLKPGARIVEFGSHAHDFESVERIDALCDAFESEYRAGRVPAIEDFVARSSDLDRSSLVVELVLLDVAYREQRGESPALSDYSQRFPDESDSLRRCFSPDPESADQSFESTITQGVVAKTDTEIASPLVRLGRYELVELLGTGGFGDVWKSRDPALDRWVAIKTLRADREFPPEVVERFLEEGRKLARLEHPFIVPVYDVGFAQDRCYIVSKLIWGETLEDMIRRETRLSPVESARTVARMADALHHAHLQGLVHRDIKPSNILLDKQGRPHLADFGLAISEEEQLDEGPSTVGTYAYMSPEQVRGSSNLVDARSDVYSLGIVLYRLVTGRTPFLARNRSEWEQLIRSRPPRPPRTIDDDIPAPLEEVCLKCLNKEIEQRYTTAADLADALRQASTATSATTPSRKSGFAITAAVVMLAAALFAALALIPDSVHDTSDPDAVHPVELVWPYGDRRSYWTVAPGGRTLVVNCAQYGIIRIGELMPDEPNAEISVNISQINPTGYIGLIWGHRDADDDADFLQYELLKIAAKFGGAPILLRKLVRLDPDNSLDRSESDISQVDIDEPGSAEHTMTVRIRNGRVVDLEWDGVSQSQLVEGARYPHWADDEASGEIGVFVDGTSANFSNIRIDGELIRFSDSH